MFDLLLLLGLIVLAYQHVKLKKITEAHLVYLSKLIPSLINEITVVKDQYNDQNKVLRYFKEELDSLDDRLRRIDNA